ncbi:poly-beta-1,6-N-acetyl-D-glucosamine biosynthesis protein PgaD [Desulforhopalus sp. 52FAK]
MNRISRNQNYRIQSTKKLPLLIVLRDIVLTLLAWFLIIYLCGDFILQLTYGVLHEFDTDPLNDLDWALFAKNLRISFLFSGSVLTFITAWAISNLLLLRRTQRLEGINVPQLRLRKEVKSYGCSEEDVRKWRKEKIVTVSIDDTGQILSVTTPT